jgi:hypothetical protein
MPKITTLVAYNAVQERIDRLGLAPLIEEVKNIVGGFELRVLEQRDANGGREVRKLIDVRFRQAGWLQEERGRGDIDWIKRETVNGTTVAVGVELQVSGRGGGSHLSDISHLRAGLAEAQDGRIDIGILIVPTDRLAVYLTDRVEGLTQVQRYVRQMSAENLPLLLIAIEHDGPGAALPKQPKKAPGE